MSQFWGLARKYLDLLFRFKQCFQEGVLSNLSDPPRMEDMPEDDLAPSDAHRERLDDLPVLTIWIGSA